MPMKSSFPLSFLFIVLFLFACKKNDDSATNGQDPKTEEPKDGENTENLLLQLQGTQITDADKNPVYLQGVAFSNFIWSDTPFPEVHHSEVDYQRVKDMGMNTIRFYMNYRYFEDDANPYAYKQSGWDWLDENIAWAKKYDIYLILNMHAPQGGYQSSGEGDALWDVVENQNRLAALWKAIAERYVDEVQIAGFGPVNEPVPNNSVDQWTQLAQKLIDEIRSVNKNHLLFIERANYVKGNPAVDENLNFPIVTGENIVYEFHGYDPYIYTHQLLEFTALGDGGKYPDESMLEVLNSQWSNATFGNPSLPSGTTDWTYFEGERFKLTDNTINFGQPILEAAQVGGRVYFDDIVIKEYDENDNFVRNIYQANLNSLDGWSFWSINGSGTSGLSNTVGHNDTGSLYIDGTTGNGNMSNLQQRFVVRPNYSYEISGWMRGENLVSSASGKLLLEFYTTTGSVFIRNKAYLEAIAGEIVDWAKTNNAALYMEEFGVGYPCFQNSKGGLQFVRDMVDINKVNNIHFTYHVYHEDNFGLYLGGALPDPGNTNQPLIDLFADILN